VVQHQANNQHLEEVHLLSNLIPLQYNQLHRLQEILVQVLLQEEPILEEQEDQDQHLDHRLLNNRNHPQYSQLLHPQVHLLLNHHLDQDLRLLSNHSRHPYNQLHHLQEMQAVVHHLLNSRSLLPLVALRKIPNQEDI
jgi:hypothetical protein